MPSARLVVAALALLATLGGAAALAWWSQGDAGAPGAFHVEVVGPEGILFAGPVDLDAATALAALQAAATAGGFAVETVDYPGMGTYVRAVAGHAADGPDGWVYEVLRAGEWRNGDRSADAFALEPGDAVRWSWTST